MRFFLAHEPRNYIKKHWNPYLKSSDLKNDDRLYLWQIYDDHPLDGLLVSYHPLKTRAPGYLRERIEKIGIHAALDYDGTILGESGAFGYLEKEKPPYSTDQLLEFYDKCGFDIGATLDHLIWGKMKQDKQERDRRFDITMKNAREMYKKWKRKHRGNFTLMGIAQGWNPESYANAVKMLLDIGFSYIGIGGLAGASSRTIAPVLSKVHSCIHSLGADAKIHVFGTNPLRKGAPDLLSVFKHKGISSFDTTIMLRQAWSRRKDNYFINNAEYTSIRVSTDLKEEVAKEALFKLREYADHKCPLNSVMDILRGIEERKDEKWLEFYQKTLEKRPWEKCTCKICKELGIDILIFRGNERNMRRGFHNVYQFYHRFIEKNIASVLDYSK